MFTVGPRCVNREQCTHTRTAVGFGLINQVQCPCSFGATHFGKLWPNYPRQIKRRIPKWRESIHALVHTHVLYTRSTTDVRVRNRANELRIYFCVRGSVPSVGSQMSIWDRYVSGFHWYVIKFGTCGQEIWKTCVSFSLENMTIDMIQILILHVFSFVFNQKAGSQV